MRLGRAPESTTLLSPPPTREGTTLARSETLAARVARLWIVLSVHNRLQDASPADRPNLFMNKLRLCSKSYDFSDPDSDTLAKERKR